MKEHDSESDMVLYINIMTHVKTNKNKLGLSGVWATPLAWPGLVR